MCLVPPQFFIGTLIPFVNQRLRMQHFFFVSSVMRVNGFFPLPSVRAMSECQEKGRSLVRN